jgi:Tfp pilus assembly protein PilN
MIALQSQRVDMAKVLSVVLFLVFLTMSLYNIGFTTFKYIQTRQELIATRGEQDQVRTTSTTFSAKIRQMQALKTQVVAYLEFTREELPAVEFMKALEDAVPQGLKISSLSIRPGNVLMVGSALSDAEIIALSLNLGAMSYIVTRVDAPVTTKSVLGTIQISDFRLTCDIRKILDVAADDPNQQQIQTSVVTATEGGGG